MSKFVAYLTYHSRTRYDYRSTPHTVVYKVFDTLEDAEKYVEELEGDYYDREDRYIAPGSDECGMTCGDVEEFYDDELDMIDSYIKTLARVDEYTSVWADK